MNETPQVDITALAFAQWVSQLRESEKMAKDQLSEQLSVARRKLQETENEMHLFKKFSNQAQDEANDALLKLKTNVRKLVHRITEANEAKVSSEKETRLRISEIREKITMGDIEFVKLNQMEKTRHMNISDRVETVSRETEHLNRDCTILKDQVSILQKELQAIPEKLRHAISMLESDWNSSGLECHRLVVDVNGLKHSTEKLRLACQSYKRQLELQCVEVEATMTRQSINDQSMENEMDDNSQNRYDAIDSHDQQLHSNNSNNLHQRGSTTYHQDDHTKQNRFVNESDQQYEDESNSFKNSEHIRIPYSVPSGGLLHEQLNKNTTNKGQSTPETMKSSLAIGSSSPVHKQLQQITSSIRPNTPHHSQSYTVGKNGTKLPKAISSNTNDDNMQLVYLNSEEESPFESRIK